MFRLLIIALLVVGVPALVLAQEKEKGPDPKEVKQDPPTAKGPAKVEETTYVVTPHWTKKVPMELVQLAFLVIIAALLGLGVGQLSGLKASIDKVADKMGGGGGA